MKTNFTLVLFFSITEHLIAHLIHIKLLWPHRPLPLVSRNLFHQWVPWLPLQHFSSRLSLFSAWRITSSTLPPWSKSSNFLTSGSALTISSFSLVICEPTFYRSRILGSASEDQECLYRVLIASLWCPAQPTHQARGLLQHTCCGSTPPTFYF